MADETLLTLTADIVSAHVANNSVATSDMAALIAKVHDALAGLGKPVEEEVPVKEPAVSIRASVKPDFIVCLEDGKKLKMLKRHLMSHYQMTPADYRTKWNLPSDYPMVAPNYAEQRKGLALKIGLGRKKADVPPPEAKPSAKRPRAKAEQLVADQ
ncbi:MAG: MucR family transcriptional regulator [Planctomycetota bacterium]